MKLLAKSKNGQMFKMEDTTNPKGYVWYFLAPNVAEFAKKIEVGADLELKVEEKSEGETIVFVKTAGSSATHTAKSASSYTPKTEFKCEKCGVALKDNKYKTCYNCSMEAKEKTASSPEEQNRQDSIKRQAIGNMTSRGLIALQGHVDPNNICDIAETLYKKFQELVG